MGTGSQCAISNGTLVPGPCVSSKNILTKRLKAYCDYVLITRAEACPGIAKLPV